MKKAKWQRAEKLVSKLVGATPVHELDKKGIDAVVYTHAYQVKYTEKDKFPLRELVNYSLDVDIIVCFGFKIKNKYTYTVYSLKKVPFHPSAYFVAYIYRDDFWYYGNRFLIYYQSKRICFEVRLLAYEDELN